MSQQVILFRVDISDCVIILTLFYVYWLKMCGCYIDCFCDLTYPISMYW
jgi:hypothetical protein